MRMFFWWLLIWERKLRTRRFTKISRKAIEKLGIYRILETIPHENTHANQDFKIEKGQFNRDTYRMLKEQLIRNQDESFYTSNYSYMYNEIDARKNGYIRRNRILKRIGLTDSQIMELQTENMDDKVAEYCRYMKEAKSKKNRTRD